MTRSLLISGLYVAAALSAETDSIVQNPSPTVQEVKGVAAVAAAPPAAQTGPFGLPSLSDFSGFGWLGSSSGGLFGGRGNSPQVSSKQLWQPKVGSPFQIILSSAIVLHNSQTQGRTSSLPSTGPTAQIAFPLVPERVDIFDIDLWDNPAETVERLHASGKKVICYFSAGTSEDWRSDFKEFRTQDMGASLPLWKGERWLDIRQRSVWKVMQKRIELASKRGCDAIDPDNIDAYDNENGGGFRRPLTKSDAITYIRKLSREAKRYGMSTGLKNSADILKSVDNDVHFAVNEECAQMKECGIYKDFLYPKDGKSIPKPVFHIEYVHKKAKAKKIPVSNTAPKAVNAGSAAKGLAPKTIHNRDAASSENPIADLYDIFNALWPNASTPFIRKNLCLGTPPTGIGSRMSTVIKEFSLGGWVMYCDGGTADTRTLLPDGQTPKKGTSEEKGGAKPTTQKTRGGRPFRNRLNTTSLEMPEEGPEGTDGAEGQESGPQDSVESNDGDFLATIVNNPGTQLTDDVWNSDVGPISEEDLKPDPEVKHKGAGKDRRGPEGYVNNPSERRAVLYFS